MTIENGYTVLDTTLVVGTIERRLMECNENARYVIQGGLIRSKFVNVMHCTSAK